MSNYYQNPTTQLAMPLDFSALSDQALAYIHEYREYQTQETAVDMIGTQRAITVGRIAMMGYSSLLQDYNAYSELFPEAVDDYNEILGAVREDLCERIRGRRRY